jgi:hypothetical protein
VCTSSRQHQPTYRKAPTCQPQCAAAPLLLISRSSSLARAVMLHASLDCMACHAALQSLVRPGMLSSPSCSIRHHGDQML